MSNTYNWKSGATNFGLASSWIPSGGPPTSSDNAEIDVAANVSGTGVAQELDINATGVTVSSPLTTTVGNAAIIGNSAVGGVTVSSTWNANGYLQVGGADAGTLTINGGGDVNQTVNSNSPYMDVGENAGAKGTLTVQGGGKLTTQAHYLTIGDKAGSSGVMTISGAGSTVTIADQLTAGNGGDAQVTVGNGGSLITKGTTSNSFYDTIGWLAGATGSVTVTGAGSSWKSANNIQAGGLAFYGGGGTGTLAATDGGFIQAADGVTVYTGGTISVDSTSVIEAGTAGGAKAGYLTLDANGGGLYGDGAVDANIIDNNFIGTTDGGPMTINGNITGSGGIGIGDQVDLVLNGSVAVGNASFNGWYGTLSLADPGQFNTPVYNFVPGDAIDLTNTPYDAADSSYSYLPGALKINEGANTYTLNVNSTVPLSGALTLEKDASGNGTDVIFTSPPASPFNLWGTPLPNFYSTASGPVNGEDWAPSTAADGGTPIWVETETPASTYTQGAAANYTIVLTTQDWLGTEQPLVTVATDANFVDPFGSSPSSIGNLGASPSAIGNLAAATIFNGGTGSGAVLYWTNSATSGDYALELQRTTTTYPTAPSTGPNTVLTGSPITLLPAVSQPVAWTYTTNGTSNSAATKVLVGYATANTSTTENFYVQGFTTAGVALGGLVEVASDVADGLPELVGYTSSTGDFYLSYAQIGGTGGTGLYTETVNPTTGAIGASSQFLSLADYTSISGFTANTLSSGTKLRIVEGFIGSQQVIQDFFGNGTLSPVTTFNLGSTTPDHYQIAAVFDPNDGSNDYTVLAYTDNNHVHLELLNDVGVQIGSDFTVPGLTSFDQIHTLTASIVNADTRVEIDYTVTDPSGGTEVEGLIYDTASGPYYYTLGSAGNNEYQGTPFNDTITDAPGTYTVNGGGGDDTFVVNEPANQVAISFDGSKDAIVRTYSSAAFSPSTLTGTATLIGFTTIQLNNATTTISQTANGGTLPFGVGYAVDFVNVNYATGDTVTVTPTPGGPSQVGVFSGGTEIASFSVYGDFQAQDFTLGQLTPTAGLSIIGVAAPIVDNGVTQLTQVENHYELETGSGGSGPLLEYLGSPVTAGGAWAPVGAEKTESGYEVAWRDASANEYTVWNTDLNGDYTSSATGILSGASYALEDLELSFGEDINGDGTIGPTTTSVGTNGSLAQVANQYALESGGSIQAWVESQGSPITAVSGATWAPVGAAQTGDGYEVAWRDASANEYTVWNTDLNGDYTTSATGVLTGSSQELEAVEGYFGEHFAGAGTPTSATPINGITPIGNLFELTPGGGTGPLLEDQGSVITSGGAWTPVMAAKTGNGYEVAWANASAHEFTVWNTDLNGDYTSSATGVLTGSSPEFEAVEGDFGVQLAGAGTRATPGTPVNGITPIGDLYELTAGGGTGALLEDQGSLITSGGAWAPIAAVKTGNGYEVAWRDASANEYTVWNTDLNGDYTSSATGVLSGASYALEDLELSFGEDLNGDGTTGPTTTSIGTNGSLAQVANQYALESGGTIQAWVESQGSPITAVSGATWAPVGAAQTGNGYEVAWRDASANEYTVWNTDLNGDYTTSATGVLTGSSQELEAVEGYFGEHFAGAGTPTSATPINGITPIGNLFELTPGGGTGPLLEDQGSVITSGGAWAPVMAAKTGNGYEVAWANASAHEFTVWNTDLNGDYTSSATGVLTGSSPEFEAVEGDFGVQLAGAGTRATPGTPTNGITPIGDLYELTAGGGTGALLEDQGSLITSGGAWAPIAAVKTGNGYEVAWRDASANEYTVWNTDLNGDYTSSATGVLTGSSQELEAVEGYFGAHFAGGGTPATPRTPTNGITPIGDLFELNPGGGTGPLLQYQGGLVTAGGAWTPVGAEKTATGYEVAWSLLGSDQYTVWNTDGNGDYTSSATGVVSGQSFALEDLEPAFGEDLNGDGRLSAVLVTTTGPGDTLNLSGQTQATTINLGDNAASANAGLNAPSIGFTGTPDAITLGSDADIVEYALKPSSGIETIANFTLGQDELNIDLEGAADSTLHMYNTTVGGMHAISIASSADPAHGLVLLNMPAADTAASLLASHTTFIGGHALIS